MINIITDDPATVAVRRMIGETSFLSRNFLKELIMKLSSMPSKVEMQEMHDALKYIESRFEKMTDEIRLVANGDYDNGCGSPAYKVYSDAARELSRIAFMFELKIHDGQRAPQFLQQHV